MARILTYLTAGRGFALAAKLLLGLTLLLTSVAVHADDDSVWQRQDKKGIRTASVNFGVNNVMAISCPAATLPTAQPLLLVHVQALQAELGYASRYNLRISIDDFRADFGMTAKDGSLLFEATDFNQRQSFQDFVQEFIKAAHNGEDHAQMALFTLGWRGDVPLAGADEAFDGLMDGCGE